MTVIAYRDGVIAADTAIWQSSIIVGHRQKIVRLKDGRLLACAGPIALAMAVEEWLNGGEKPPVDGKDGFEAVLLSGDGLYLVDALMRVFPAPPGFQAIGAHNEFMAGAMAAGASADQAVQLAIEYGDSAAGEVQVERLAPLKARYDALNCAHIPSLAPSERTADGR